MIIADHSDRIFSMSDMVIQSVGNSAKITLYYGNLIINKVEDNATILMEDTTNQPRKLIIRQVGKNVTITCKANCNIIIQGRADDNTTIHTRSGNIKITQIGNYCKVSTDNGDIKSLSIGKGAELLTECGNIDVNLAAEKAKLISKRGLAHAAVSHESTIMEGMEVESTNISDVVPNQKGFFSSFFSLFCNFADNEETTSKPTAPLLRSPARKHY